MCQVLGLPQSLGPQERQSGLSVGSMGAWGVVKSLYPEEEKWNWANQATEAGKAALGSSLLWGLGASLLWSLGWAAKLVVAMAPASSQSSKCCCSEGGDPFCGLDRPSHTPPPLLFLSLQKRPLPMVPPHPHTKGWSPDYTLDRAPRNWPARSLDQASGHSRLCVGSSLSTAGSGSSCPLS